VDWAGQVAVEALKQGGLAGGLLIALILSVGANFLLYKDNRKLTDKLVSITSGDVESDRKVAAALDRLTEFIQLWAGDYRMLSDQLKHVIWQAGQK
jgi:hypothetical protein